MLDIFRKVGAIGVGREKTSHPVIMPGSLHVDLDAVVGAFQDGIGILFNAALAKFRAVPYIRVVTDV